MRFHHLFRAELLHAHEHQPTMAPPASLSPLPFPPASPPLPLSRIRFVRCSAKIAAPLSPSPASMPDLGLLSRPLSCPPTPRDTGSLVGDGKICGNRDSVCRAVFV